MDYMEITVALHGLSAFFIIIYCFQIFNTLKFSPVFPIHLAVLAMDFQGYLVSRGNEPINLRKIYVQEVIYLVKWAFPC